jgi:uncharacterized lipoprotein YmbA
MKYALAIIAALSLVSCASPTPAPTLFETGVQVPAPLGCEEAKKEGRDVKC